MKQVANVVVTDQALRELVNELIGPRSTGPSHLDRDITLGSPTVPDDEPVNVNATVDPSACETDPINPDYTPQSKQEFDVAIKNLVKNLPDEKMPTLYKDIKDVVFKAEEPLPQGDKPVKDTEKSSDELMKSKAEEVIRREVKKIIAEVPLKGKGSRTPSDRDIDLAIDDLNAPPHELELDDDDDEDEDKPRRKFASVADVEGASFEEIAKELGFSVAGAKQLVDKALLKARFMATMDPDESEILVLTAANDYISMLARTGELTDADVRLMKDHPQIVRELSGFREYLHNVIRRARRKAGE